MIVDDEEQVAEMTVNIVTGGDTDEQVELAELYARERANTADKLGSEESRKRWARTAEELRESSDER